MYRERSTRVSYQRQQQYDQGNLLQNFVSVPKAFERQQSCRENTLFHFNENKKEAEVRGNFGKQKSHFSQLNLSQSSSRFSQNSAIVARTGFNTGRGGGGEEIKRGGTNG